MKCLKIILAGIVFSAALASTVTMANPFPTKPITIIVPFPPGAGSDVVARTLADKLYGRLGQPVIVENRPGAAGMLGANVVAKAAPDGYTILIAANTLLIAPYVLPKSAIVVNIKKELAPVIMAVSNPMVLAVNPSMNVTNVRDLVQFAKNKPGLPYASGGNGSPMHIAGELFKRAAEIDLTHVPYKGTAPSINDTIAGQVQVLWAPWGGAAPQVRAGRLRALAVADNKRYPSAPGVPSMAELGYPDVISEGWLGIFVPGQTPNSIIDKINKEINTVLELDDVRERIISFGFNVVGGSTEKFTSDVIRDSDRYERLVKELGISSD